MMEKCFKVLLLKVSAFFSFSIIITSINNLKQCIKRNDNNTVNNFNLQKTIYILLKRNMNGDILQSVQFHALLQGSKNYKTSNNMTKQKIRFAIKCLKFNKMFEKRNFFNVRFVAIAYKHRYELL